ncbi:MAG: CopG family transcriptional regulator [Bryobacterales bacterium]|nr:CopG family transcriptional regulator [Bryobacterales bacterium]MBV9401670.1 CopG family transcriptional regulator [Bryobacterales bacterium]
MVRTQISLDEKGYALAKKEARKLGVSVSELIRRSPWMRYVGMVESGDPNSSLNIDQIVYGHKD